MVADDAVCYRHPDTHAAVGCQRCGRPICGRCMVNASVGSHCPECTQSSGQKVYRPSDLRSSPRLIHALIAICVVTFVFQMSAGGGSAVRGQVYLRGVLFGPLVAEGEVWRIVSAGFLHGDPIHLAFNMYMLYLVGPMVERVLGVWDTLLVYAGGLLGGSMAVLMFNYGSPTLGASGAVLGMAGALAALYRANGIPLRQSSLGGIFLINLALPLLGTGISFWGHLGGIVGGAVLGWILSRKGPSPAATAGLGVARGMAVAALVVMLVAGIWAASIGGVATIL
jgi:membrane associated rhomboid family serine protease